MNNPKPTWLERQTWKQGEDEDHQIVHEWAHRNWILTLKWSTAILFGVEVWADLVRRSYPWHPGTYERQQHALIYFGPWQMIWSRIVEVQP